MNVAYLPPHPVPKLRTSDPATIAQPSTNTKKIVFIMLTGSSDRDLVQKAAALGVNNYLVKPFAPAALKDKIERVFGELS